MTGARYYHPIQAARARVVLRRAVIYLERDAPTTPAAAILSAHKSTGYPVGPAMAAWRHAGNLTGAVELVKDRPAPLSVRDVVRMTGGRR